MDCQGLYFVIFVVALKWGGVEVIIVTSLIN